MKVSNSLYSLLLHFSKITYLTLKARVTATLSPLTSTDRTRRLSLIGLMFGATIEMGLKGYHSM